MNEKKVYESAEIKIVSLDRDMLITSSAALGEDDWDTFSFNLL